MRVSDERAARLDEHVQMAHDTADFGGHLARIPARMARGLVTATVTVPMLIDDRAKAVALLRRLAGMTDHAALVGIMADVRRFLEAP